MTVGNGGDDVLRTERGVTAEKNFGMSRLECNLIDDWHLPFIKLEADVALYPRKSVFLADCNQYVIRRIKSLWFARRQQRTLAVLIINGLDLFKRHPH